ncbi:hypothetical protein GM3708_2840 [Geminocystis sp. NIES-3708]|nr:hypothetical protein GM3708_2840 [Geminocystis sp. NIES-3708]
MEGNLPLVLDALIFCKRIVEITKNIKKILFKIKKPKPQLLIEFLF